MCPRRTLLVLAVLAGIAAAQTPTADFKTSCSSCHTIGGGRLTGPDLKDVGKRKDRAWLVRFINGTMNTHWAPATLTINPNISWLAHFTNETSRSGTKSTPDLGYVWCVRDKQ